MDYNYIINLSKHTCYDFHVSQISLYCDEGGNEMDLTTFDSADWGVPSTLKLKVMEKHPLPVRLEMRWIPFMGDQYYELSATLDQAKAEELWEKQQRDFPKAPFDQYMIGIAPFGGVAIWLCNSKKSVLLEWLQAKGAPLPAEIVEDVKLFTDPEKEALVNATLAPEKLQSNMRQYRYRFVPLEEFYNGEQWQRYDSTNAHYEEIDLDNVEVKRLDGSFDFTESDEVMHYQSVGKPQRIMVRWHEGESSYFAHFWLDEAEATAFFDGFFNAFPDANADLLLRIDTRANRYEIALTGEKLQPHTLKNTQYLVCKDFEEIARSENYTKEKGDWHWS